MRRAERKYLVMQHAVNLSGLLLLQDSAVRLKQGAAISINKTSLCSDTHSDKKFKGYQSSCFRVHVVQQLRSGRNIH